MKGAIMTWFSTRQPTVGVGTPPTERFLPLRTVAALGLAVALVGLAACKSTEGPGEAVDQVEALRETIAKVVQDSARSEAMLAEVDGMVTALEELGRTVEAQKEKIHGLIAAYDTPRAELDEAMVLAVSERRKVVDKVAERHFKLKDLATADEWKAIAKKERAALAWAASRILGETPVLEA